jgi:hypothetical protein
MAVTSEAHNAQAAREPSGSRRKKNQFGGEATCLEIQISDD